MQDSDVVDFVSSDSWVASTQHVTPQIVFRLPIFSSLSPPLWIGSLQTEGSRPFQHVGGAEWVRLLLGFSCCLLDSQSLVTVTEWASNALRELDEQGASKILWKGLSGRTRSNCAVVRFPLPSSPLQSAAEAAPRCWCCDWTHPSWAQHAAVCPAGSRLQSSVVQPDGQTHVVMYPIIAGIPSWGYSLTGAFEGQKQWKLFLSQSWLSLPQCCFKNIDLFWAGQSQGWLHSTIGYGFLWCLVCAGTLMG